MGFTVMREWERGAFDYTAQAPPSITISAAVT
jgi:hypothetical protein